MNNIEEDNIKQILLDYIKKEFGIEPAESKSHFSYCYYPFEECSCKKLNEITCETSLMNGGYIDSFSMVSILVYIETTFNIVIPDIDAVPHNFDSVNKMLYLIKRLKISK